MLYVDLDQQKLANNFEVKGEKNMFLYKYKSEKFGVHLYSSLFD